MHHAVQIETQAKEQGLTHLHTEAAVGGASRELGLDRREYALDQSGAPVAPIRKTPAASRFALRARQASLAALGGDRGLRSELRLNVGAIPLAIELGIGKHQPKGCMLGNRCDQGGQIRAVVPWTGSCGLRQRELLIQNLPRSPPFKRCR
jgi:hypothetical protein